jgi:hypothetical protein
MTSTVNEVCSYLGRRNTKGAMQSSHGVRPKWQIERHVIDLQSYLESTPDSANLF